MTDKRIYLSGLLGIIGITHAAIPSAIAEDPNHSYSSQTSSASSSVSSEEAICSSYSTAEQQAQLIASATTACGEETVPVFGGSAFTAGSGVFCFSCASKAELAAYAGSGQSSSDEGGQSSSASSADGYTFVANVPKIRICASKQEPRTIPSYQGKDGKIIPAKRVSVTVYKWFNAPGGKPPQGWKLAAPAKCENLPKSQLEEGFNRAFEGIKRHAPAAAAGAAAGAIGAKLFGR